MGLAVMLRNLIFGKRNTQNYREAVHDNKNALQASSGAARKTKKQGEEALWAAEYAIKLLEKGKEGKDK